MSGISFKAPKGKAPEGLGTIEFMFARASGAQKQPQPAITPLEEGGAAEPLPVAAQQQQQGVSAAATADQAVTPAAAAKPAAEAAKEAAPPATAVAIETAPDPSPAPEAAADATATPAVALKPAKVRGSPAAGYAYSTLCNQSPAALLTLTPTVQWR